MPDVPTRMEAYLKSTIKSHEEAIKRMEGELSGLRSALSALRQFRKDAE